MGIIFWRCFRFGRLRRGGGFLGHCWLTVKYVCVNLDRNPVDFGNDPAQVLALFKKARGGGIAGDIHHFGINADAVSQNG